MVLAHARALLVGAVPGGTAYVQEDLRDPESILREATQFLDFSEPVALMLLSVLHFLDETDQPETVVKTLLDAGITMHARDSDQFARLAFSGLEMVPPGVVLVSEWRPGMSGPLPTPAEVSCYGGIGCKLLSRAARPRPVSWRGRGSARWPRHARRASGPAG
jgi:hypothetical protein